LIKSYREGKKTLFSVCPLCSLVKNTREHFAGKGRGGVCVREREKEREREGGRRRLMQHATGLT
jgi:hypothetical protein